MASASGPRSGRLAVACGAALGLLAFAYLLAWPPTLNQADESFTLYGAKRVFQGDALYHDFFDFIAPGSIYLYALAYAVGGVSITTARVTTALLNAASVVCTYALALQVASKAEAVLAGLLVVVLCVPVWNMASHHWLATALGLASAAVLLAGRWRHSTRARPAVASLLAGLLVSSHQSRGAGMIVWLALVVPVLAHRRGPGAWRRVVRELAWTAAGGAVACVAVLGYAVWRASLAEFIYATQTWVLENYRTFHLVGAGSWQWAATGGYTTGWLAYTWYPLLRAQPWLLALEGTLILWTLVRRGADAVGLRVALLLLTALAASSVLYFPDFIHVAFVTPYVLIVLAGTAYRARTALPGLDGRAGRIVAGVAWLALTGLVVGKAANNLALARRTNPVRFATAFGTLAGQPYLEQVVRDLRAQVPADPARPAHVFNYPGDAWLYLALPADNPTRYALLRPVYSTPEQIAEAQADLLATPDARIMVNFIHVPLDDPIVQWMREHFRDAAGLGPHDPKGVYAYRLFAPGGR